MLAARGSRVAFTYSQNRAGAADMVAELEQNTEGAAWSLDITDSDQARDAIGEIVDRVGGIHTFVHAAGPHIPQLHLSKVTPAQFRENLDVEVMGFFTLAHVTLAHLRAAQGSIVAVTTAATRRYPVRDGLSAGTKGSVEALVRALAVEEGRFGVRANCVGPGMLTDGMATRLMAAGDLDETALTAAMKNIPLRRFGRARDIAEAVCFLASSRANFISGQMLDVDGAYGA
jgi:NAD(P)-dependent dehydrogenase (short-subunit alcohol dehydrogenase family)